MDNKVAMLIDTSKCTACRGCQVACKQWNELPAETTKFFGGEGYQNPADLSGVTFTLVKFKEVASNGDLRWLFRKHQCLHCTQASCVNVCPVKAITKNELGFTQRNLKKCIGCKLCVIKCPFKVPRLDKNKKAQSCRFCADRVMNNLTPACAKTCPSGAIQFGERSAIIKIAKVRVDILGGKSELYGMTQGGGLGVMYVLKDSPDVYGLPTALKVAEPLLLPTLLGSFGRIAFLGSLVGLAIEYFNKTREEG